MKKYFVVACSLLLFSNTATFAQMSKIIPDGMLVGDVNIYPPRETPGGVVISNSFKLAVNKPMFAGGTVFEGHACLTLKNNELVMETTVTEIYEGHVLTDTKQVWSIPFSGSAKELEFQPGGGLVVRDSNNKVLWTSNVSASRVKWFTMGFNGKMQIVSENGDILWEK